MLNGVLIMKKAVKQKKSKSESDLKADWVNYKPADVEKIIEKLAGEGKQASVIGTILRDVYGIPKVNLILKKPLKQILSEKGFAPKIPEDLRNLIKRALNVRKHLELNKHDVHSKRGLGLIESKIKKLVKYYKRKGLLPDNWIYTPEKTKLLVE